MILYSAATEKGSRNGNQDNLRVAGQFDYVNSGDAFSDAGCVSGEDVQVFCVCDGVGGAALGDLASKQALIGVARYLEDSQSAPQTMEQRVLGAAEAAQSRVRDMYARLRTRGGCTLTLIGISGDDYALVNVGDSPAFLYRADGGLTELSVRHNLAAMKEREGIPAAWGDEQRLIRYMGKEDQTAADMAHCTAGKLRTGDRILLCSDGVTNAFVKEQLAELLGRGVTAQELTTAAAAVEYADNCTAVVLEFTA